AKGQVVVTLDGQGADEQLAGYHYFFGYHFKDLLKRMKLMKLLSESFYYMKNHNSIYGLKTMIYFLIPETLKSGLRTSEHNYINKDFLSRYSLSNSITKNLYGSKSLNEALYDHFEFKLEHLLKWEDRNSMNFSLESRVPFLDHRLVEKTLSLPSDKIIRKGVTKKILREAMNGVLPESIRLRKDKVGFETPQDKWFRTDKFKNFIIELLSSESFRKRGIINIDRAEKMYSDHLKKKSNVSKEIWKWINLELWFREFID
ncbi:MAG: asparagine synthetase B, partial [Candidatus Aminicenantes bacterium]|nr:asparagine synthetase B [Candidatus Aminicenantes bacterium]